MHARAEEGRGEVGPHLYSVCVSEELVLETSEELSARKANIRSARGLNDQYRAPNNS